MSHTRHLAVGLLIALLAASLMFGCRAWEPEAIIVNKPPKVYIIGSPAETTGGYYHFRVFWYGTDEDGFVERYVWALTDTSIQDPLTDEDEEDRRFNPATDASTLEIGRWTTRTDTIFDFQIGQGAALQYDMTLHLVAQDDRGAFSRRPARLHFFANALGNPRLLFFRNAVAAGNEFADYDTVGFQRPLTLAWAGETVNTTGYDPARLALVDTVNPPGQPPDGLLGFKWRLPDFDDCNAAIADCWRPQRRDPATGDSVSYFGEIYSLTFRNQSPTAATFLDRRYPAGILRLLVNTIDIAGVEIPASKQTLNIVVNYDPDTYILRQETDPVAAHGDGIVYPVYTVFHGPEAGTYSFGENDTVPDRSYVLFKAMGWDAKNAAGEARDELLGAYQMQFQGSFIASQFYGGGGLLYSIRSPRSILRRTTAWTAEVATDPSADTLGFLVGPFDYKVIMVSADEHLKRDGTPDTFSFVANYPPCVQCIELGNRHLVAGSTFTPEVTYATACYDAACLADAPQLVIYHTDDPRHAPTVDPTHLTRLILYPNTVAVADTIYVDPIAGQVTLNRPLHPDEWYKIRSSSYFFLVYLHGKDHIREYWPPNLANRRIAAWKYEINYQGDGQNIIKDGGGNDDIRFLSGFPINSNLPDPTRSSLYIDPVTGVWAIRVKVAVPEILLADGPQAYWDDLLARFGCPAPPPAGSSQQDTLTWQMDPDVLLAYETYRLTMMQLTPGTVDAIAADQSRNAWRGNSNCFYWFPEVRTPTLLNVEQRTCTSWPANIPIQGTLSLSDFIAYSNRGVPVRKEFDVVMYSLGGEAPITGDQPPPNWVTAKGGWGRWR